MFEVRTIGGEIIEIPENEQSNISTPELTINQFYQDKKELENTIKAFIAKYELKALHYEYLGNYEHFDTRL